MMKDYVSLILNSPMANIAIKLQKFRSKSDKSRQ